MRSAQRGRSCNTDIGQDASPLPVRTCNWVDPLSSGHRHDKLVPKHDRRDRIRTTASHFTDDYRTLEGSEKVMGDMSTNTGFCTP
jgi:hypothetical protein